eukprot:UN03539
MFRAKPNSIVGLDLEKRCQKNVSDIRTIIEEMRAYQINDHLPDDSSFQKARHAFVNEEWEQANSHLSKNHGRLNDDERLLMAMIFARENIRKAQYDMAMLHLEEILQKHPKEKLVEEFCDMVERAWKLQRKIVRERKTMC